MGKDDTSMKTTLFSLLIALVCDALLAEPIDVNGRFRSQTPGGFPDAWVMHEWGGYKPFPTVKTIPNACEGNTALSITNVLGDDGGAIQTRAKIPRPLRRRRPHFAAGEGKRAGLGDVLPMGREGPVERGHRQFAVCPLRDLAAARLDDSHRQRPRLRNARRHARHRRQDGGGDPDLQFDPRHPAGRESSATTVCRNPGRSSVPSTRTSNRRGNNCNRFRTLWAADKARR